MILDLMEKTGKMGLGVSEPDPPVPGGGGGIYSGRPLRFPANSSRI